MTDGQRQEKDRQAVSGVLDQYRNGLATLDVEALQGIWDRTHDPLVYIALERQDAIRDWAGIARYYEVLAQALASVNTIELADITIDLLGETALAYLTFHFVGDLHGKMRIADGRITFGLHRTGNGWRVIHYHESAHGPYPGT